MDFEQADAVNQAIRLLSLRHRARAAGLLAPLGLHPGQEVLLLELARTGPMIQAQLSEALGCEPPSVTLMTRKLEASGHLRRTPTPADKRATIVELTDRGTVLAEQVKQLWCALAEETVTGLPAETVAELPGILTLAQRQSRREAAKRVLIPATFGLDEHIMDARRTPAPAASACHKIIGCLLPAPWPISSRSHQTILQPRRCRQGVSTIFPCRPPRSRRV
jgi:DNA-binding MarR family transcriptional regulator